MEDRSNNLSIRPIPPGEIEVGIRVLVVVPADENCDLDTLVGAGVVTFTSERTEVIFDDGSGGMFPNRFIYRLVGG